MASASMQHWNGDQCCAIDCETTGLNPEWHEIWNIAILPLDANFDPRQDVLPFNLILKPVYPERAERKAMERIGNWSAIMDACIRGIDQDKAKDLLEDWIKTLNIPLGKYGTPKKIRPLGQNYSFDRSFIQHWLGMNTYEHYFDYHYADTMIAANYLNDRAAFHAMLVPYSKVDLTWLASRHKIKRERHDALHDALTAAKTYRAMCQQGLLG